MSVAKRAKSPKEILPPLFVGWTLTESATAWDLPYSIFITEWGFGHLRSDSRVAQLTWKVPHMIHMAIGAEVGKITIPKIAKISVDIQFHQKLVR